MTVCVDCMIGLLRFILSRLVLAGKVEDIGEYG